MLTSLYNERPACLDDAHREFDAAVVLAYGWSADVNEDDALARSLDLNRGALPPVGNRLGEGLTLNRHRPPFALTHGFSSNSCQSNAVSCPERRAAFSLRVIAA